MDTMREIVSSIKEKEGSMLDSFMAVQKKYGYIVPEAMEVIAEVYETTEAQVYETASFYSYINLEPVGEHVIRVCRSAPCCAAGALELLEIIKAELGISCGETTEDGIFTLLEGECVGQCEKSPVITIDREVYGPVTADLFKQIISQYR